MSVMQSIYNLVNSQGLLMAQPGPAFLDLLLISGVDIEKGASFFTAGSFGYIVGSVLSGVLHGKVGDDQEFIYRCFIK